MSDWNMDEKWWKVNKEDEYKNSKHLKETDVNIIQEWIKKEPHLPSLNDNQVIMFLRACEYSLEQTKVSINLNYTMRTKFPEFFSKRDLQRKTLEDVLEYLHFAIIPQPLEDDILIVCKVQEVDLSKFNVDEAIKLCFMFHDITHLEYGSNDGNVYIVDMKFINLSLLLRLPLSTVGNMLKFWQDCSTYRIKAFHIVNGGHIFKRALQLFQQFLSSELLKLIYMHDNYESLKKHLNVNNIPCDYEGNGQPLEQLRKESVETLKKYSDWFKEEEIQRVDEKKKVSNKYNDQGLQGSFKKLNLD